MIQIRLAFPEIVEAEFVHSVCAERPGVAEIPLLRAGREKRPKSRNVRAGGLKGGERIGRGIVLEIVVSRELLGAADFVVHADGELVGALVLFADLGMLQLSLPLASVAPVQFPAYGATQLL